VAIASIEICPCGVIISVVLFGGYLTMRFALLLLAGFAFAGSVSAQAATLRPAPLDAPSNPALTEVAVHCGPHAHYVKGHRSSKDHHFIKGRCVRDHHH
jgi:hypothetical protein